jgi:predicted transcriptional regulator
MFMLLQVLLAISLGYNRKTQIYAKVRSNHIRVIPRIQTLMDRGLVRNGDSGLFVTDEGARVAQHYMKALEAVGFNARAKDDGDVLN